MKYQDWPTQEHARWIAAGHSFGRATMCFSREYALRRLPEGASTEARELAVRAVNDAIYGMMMMLDGVVAQELGDGYVLGLKLVAQIEREGATAEEIELAPGGDGLCMGFHSWVSGDFGSGEL